MLKKDRIHLEIDNRQKIAECNDYLKGLIKQCAQKVIEYEEIAYSAEVSVVFVDDEQIKELNKAYRSKDTATDVLSFPMLENSTDFKEDYDITLEMDMATERVVLGDIVISLQRAKIQAEEYKHSFAREVGFLMVHGLLHLLGHDHIEEIDRETMRRHEENILNMLDLTRN